MASNTTSTDFAQAIQLFKTSGRYSMGVWTLSTYSMTNSIIAGEGEQSMLGYYVENTEARTVATMTWEDVVSDPDGIIAGIIA
jgi:hypothetical protein